MLPPGCVPECPACPHRELAPEESLARKEARLREALAPWADRLRPAAAPAPEERLGYRQRAVLAAAWQAGAWHFGLHARDTVVPIPDCPVHHPRIRAAIRLLGPALPGPPALPLRWLVVRGRQAVLVVKARTLPDLAWFDGGLARALAEAGLEGLWLHLHPATGRRVLGKGGWTLLWGEPRSRDDAGLLHGPRSFGQALPGLHDQALDLAETWLRPGPGAPVLDLCSGTGASLRRWRTAGAPALGVDLCGEAVACARANAPGAAVLQGRVSERLPQILAWLARQAPAGGAALYANPPRTGLEPGVVRWLAAEDRLHRAAILSCSPWTLARDLAVLTAGPWRVAALHPLDFLPLTRHVEVLALLVAGGSS